MTAMSAEMWNALAAQRIEVRRLCESILPHDQPLGSSHLPDFLIMQRTLLEGRLVGFAVNILHHSGVGGQGPGSQDLRAPKVIV